jgi:hypothetical protein
MKAEKEGFLPESMAVIFPRDEAIPRLPVGYLVMFLAFLLRGLSLSAHEFLCGLLFVYGVQLHQLMPNSILHIAYFLSRYVNLFWALTHTGFFGSFSFVCVLAFPWLKILSWVVLLFLCDRSRTTCSSRWFRECKARGRNGSISRTKNLLNLINMDFLLSMPARV